MPWKENHREREMHQLRREMTCVEAPRVMIKGDDHPRYMIRIWILCLEPELREVSLGKCHTRESPKWAGKLLRRILSRWGTAPFGLCQWMDCLRIYCLSFCVVSFFGGTKVGYHYWRLPKLVAYKRIYSEVKVQPIIITRNILHMLIFL